MRAIPTPGRPWRRSVSARLGLALLLAGATCAAAGEAEPPPDRCGQPEPPPAMEIDNTCARGGCHSTPGLYNTGNVNVALRDPTTLEAIAEYAAGQTYDLEYWINAPTLIIVEEFGFELTPLAGTEMAGILSPGPGTTTIPSAFGATTFLGHSPSVLADRTAGASWRFSWTAPATDVGPVTFFTCGVAANDGFGAFSDYTECRTWDVRPVAPPMDTDGDGLSDDDERDVHGTDPNEPDTDGDGLTDGQEVVGTYQFPLGTPTDPLDVDSDDDGLPDGEEVRESGTDPADCDSDADGLTDGLESGRSAPLPDTDVGAPCRGGLAWVPDAEPASTTSPTLADTDGDGCLDGDEDANRDGAVQAAAGETNPRDPSDCPVIPTTDVACGETLASSTVGGPTLRAGDACAAGDLSGPEAYFVVDFSPPGNVEVDLVDPSGTLAVLLYSNDARAPGNCLAGGIGRAVLNDPPAGRYLVVVDGPPGPGEDFSLAVSCAPSLDCGGAVDFACGQTLSGDTAAASALTTDYGCLGEVFDGPELTYRFSNPVTQTVSLILDDSANPDLDVLLLRNCNEGACVAAGDTGLTRLLEPGDYVIVVDGRNGAAAPFQLDLACANSLQPERVTATLQPGECLDESKTLQLTGEVPRTDVLFTIDLTASMVEESEALKDNIAAVLDRLGLLVNDVAYGLVSYKDYVATGNGTIPCEYDANLFGLPGDYPYRLEHPITTDPAAVDAAVNALPRASGSFDGAESSSRVLHEAAFDAAIGWREGSRRLVVDFGDDLPHDCNVQECLGGVSPLPRGIDLGRDGLIDTGDELAILDVVADLADARVTLLHFDSSADLSGEPTRDGVGGPLYEELWDCWARRTGGRAERLNPDGTVPDGRDLAELVAEVVDEQSGTCSTLELVPEPGFEDWLVSSEPEFLTDVTLPASVGFDITLCVPEGTPPGTWRFEVEARCDGGVTVSQEVVVEVEDDCSPELGAATITDLSPCSLGLLLRWDAATFPAPGATGVYDVYRSDDPDAPSCADALSRPAIALGLSDLQWLDGGTQPFQRHAYVIQARDDSGGACAGSVGRLCLEPGEVDEAVGNVTFPAAVGAVLRVAHDGDEIAARWVDARPLLVGEHFHLKKASDDPRGPFARTNPEGQVALEHRETDVSSPLQFFDLRIANSCEDESVDEYP